MTSTAKFNSSATSLCDYSLCSVRISLSSVDSRNRKGLSGCNLFTTDSAPASVRDVILWPWKSCRHSRLASPSFNMDISLLFDGKGFAMPTTVIQRNGSRRLRNCCVFNHGCDLSWAVSRVLQRARCASGPSAARPKRSFASNSRTSPGLRQRSASLAISRACWVLISRIA